MCSLFTLPGSHLFTDKLVKVAVAPLLDSPVQAFSLLFHGDTQKVVSDTHRSNANVVSIVASYLWGRLWVGQVLERSSDSPHHHHR